MSNANSESVKIKTCFLHAGGMMFNAPLIPRDIAATSLDVLDDTVLRAVISIKSSFPFAYCAVVQGSKDAPWRTRRIAAIPSCFEPPFHI